jgi:hypothetical protein
MEEDDERREANSRTETGECPSQACSHDFFELRQTYPPLTEIDALSRRKSGSVEIWLTMQNNFAYYARAARNARAKRRATGERSYRLQICRHECGLVNLAHKRLRSSGSNGMLQTFNNDNREGQKVGNEREIVQIYIPFFRGGWT